MKLWQKLALVVFLATGALSVLGLLAHANEYGRDVTATCQYRPAGVNELGESVSHRLNCQGYMVFNCTAYRRVDFRDFSLFGRPDFKYAIDGMVRHQPLRRTFKQAVYGESNEHIKRGVQRLHDTMLDALIAGKVVSYDAGSRPYNVTLADSWFRSGIKEAKAYRKACIGR